MKIIFFGSSHYVLPIIEVLRKNFNLDLVVTTEKNPTDPVVAYCLKQKIPYISIFSFDQSFISHLLSLNSELAVVADFRLILPKNILDLFPKGIINVHPSLLPKYRGPTPVQTAILNGDKETGVSIIMLDEKIDHGNILFQQREQILSNDTTESLCQKLFKIGGEILKKELKNYLDGKIKGGKQNDKNATYTKKLLKSNGYFDLDNPCLPAGRPPSKEKLERMIRAYFPWPGVWSRQMLNNKLSIIKFLPENKIQVEGKKPMNYKDFINGYSEGKELLQKLKLI